MVCNFGVPVIWTLFLVSHQQNFRFRLPAGFFRLPCSLSITPGTKMEKQKQEFVYINNILQFSVHTQASILEKRGGM